MTTDHDSWTFDALRRRKITRGLPPQVDPKIMKVEKRNARNRMSLGAKRDQQSLLKMVTHYPKKHAAVFGI